jgi:hypothetical protein
MLFVGGRVWGDRCACWADRGLVVPMDLDITFWFSTSHAEGPRSQQKWPPEFDTMKGVSVSEMIRGLKV